MKKTILAAFLSVLLLLSAIPVLAEIDLSGMSFDELVALKEQIDLAIWESDDWQEVTVPQGIYVVGEDIPAGHWTIRPVEGQRASVKWGDTLEEGGKDITYGGKIYEYELIYSTSSSSYDEGDKTELDYELEEGQYILIDTGHVVFSPFAGKPSLGFK